ncbi:MAG TPA: hypothetical protein VHO50_06430 [Bacteroidales bacterium]|nr:hypothetical protein [Bacteroidales bacterium]
MLPFGTITSIIPLFVLALAYVAFLGTSVISKNKQDEPVFHTGKKEIKVDISSIKNAGHENTLDLGSQLTADKLIDKESHPHPVFNYCRILLRSPGSIIIPDSYQISFSIRPPPLFS